eukprot:755399-Hanusia_phi.AAC.3
MDFSAGGFHSLVVTWSHDMYSCGKGWHGQLGQGDYESLTAKAKTLPQFTKLTDNLGSRNHKCVRVFGGIETSAALTDTGRLFTWGQGGLRREKEDARKEEETRMRDLMKGGNRRMSGEETRIGGGEQTRRGREGGETNFGFLLIT